MTIDLRYEYTTCIACERRWQFIDFGCAHHHLICRRVDDADVRACVVADWRRAVERAHEAQP